MPGSGSRIPENIIQLIEDAITFIHDFKDGDHSVTRRLNSLLAGEIALRAVLDMLRDRKTSKDEFAKNVENIRKELEQLKSEGACLLFEHTVSTVQGFLDESLSSGDTGFASVSASVALGYLDNALHQDKLLDDQRSRLETYRNEIQTYVATL